MTKSTKVSPPLQPNPKRPSPRKPRAKPARPQLWFEATVKNDQLRMEVGAPTKWFRVLLRLLVILLIALVILKAPELWQAIQTAVSTFPK